MVQVRNEVLPTSCVHEGMEPRQQKEARRLAFAVEEQDADGRLPSRVNARVELGHQHPLELLPRGERCPSYRGTGQRPARARGPPVELPPWERPPQPRRRPRAHVEESIEGTADPLGGDRTI